MPGILLTTLNARYSHSAFGLRYLKANLRELSDQAQILEFTINQNPRDIVESILEQNPVILGIGVYIWNTRQTLEIVSHLKKIRPSIKIVLGGPEVSYETQLQEICRLADLTVQGEGEDVFYEVCREYLDKGVWPATKQLTGVIPDVQRLKLPYSLYTDEDVRNRVIYVEASRGCPYKCEYCLSSLDKSVRSFPLESFLSEMDALILRGARQFKFVDRTFNLSVSTSSRILDFFLERMNHGLFLHFEMVPDRLPEELRKRIQQFPAGSLQFEVGIQTWDAEVAKLVSRRLDKEKTRDNFQFLVESTGVHIHADLIAGLPGETLESFARGFDSVSQLKPHEIQVGILKRLRGTPIIRHDAEWGMLYQEQAPYTVLQTRTMSFQTLQDIGRFAHFWDLIANSGNFKETLAYLRHRAAARQDGSLFWQFWDLARFLSVRHPQGHGIALIRLLESMWEYLRSLPGVDPDSIRAMLLRDYTGTVSRDIPAFLRSEQHNLAPRKQRSEPRGSTPSRQARHIGPLTSGLERRPEALSKPVIPHSSTP
jgi:radical SAM superfamily enzyme YgiQ (UPF0313 family)